MLAGIGGLLVFGKASANESSMEKETPVIRKIRPLGFQWETQDPFLFCVHHEDFYPKGNQKLGPDASLEGRQIGQDFLIKDGWRMYHGNVVPGFPGHPHRGFETVTVVRKGMVDHSDSMGASGRYGDGDVQWMTAGKGVQHAEMFPLLNRDNENHLELFQIWLNLPAKGKFVEPHFKMFWNKDLPVIRSADANQRKIRIEVIAGNLGQTNALAPPPDSWASVHDHHVAIWNIEMDPGAEYELPASRSGVNRTLYFFKGDDLYINGAQLEQLHSADVRPDIPLRLKAGNEKAHILVLQGKPINEPVVQYGPFVMNSKAEIQQAFEEFQKTRFGGWPWNRQDPVHGSEKIRFAKHSDGREEYPG